MYQRVGRLICQLEPDEGPATLITWCRVLRGFAWISDHTEGERLFTEDMRLHTPNAHAHWGQQNR